VTGYLEPLPGVLRCLRFCVCEHVDVGVCACGWAGVGP
jgi:hypothetical protein